MSVSDVRMLLLQCINVDGGAQQIAMRTLVEVCESAPDVAPVVQHLLQIVQQFNDIQVEARQLAVISLKNVVDKRWVQRNSSLAAVGETEKGALRQFLLSCWLDPNRKVAVQLAVLTSKIAQRDWPNQWPLLLPTIFQTATVPLPESGDLGWLQQARAMLALRCVLEGLSTKTLTSTKSQLARVCGEMFAPLTNVWQSLIVQLSTMLQPIFANMGTADFGMSHDVQCERLAAHVGVITAVLSCVLKKSFVSLTRRPEALTLFFETMVRYLPMLIDFLRAASKIYGNVDLGDEEGYDSSDPAGDSEHSEADFQGDGMTGFESLQRSIKKIVRDSTRIVPLLQREHPLAISPFLTPFLNFFNDQLMLEFTPENSNSESSRCSFAPLCVSAILLISGTLSCREYSDTGASNAGSSALRSKEVLREKLTLQIDAAVLGLPVSPGMDPEEIAATANACAAQGFEAKNLFFSPERVLSLFDLVLHRLLRYNAEELREWQEDPEQFVLGQDGLKETDSIKSAAEMLTVSLFDSNFCSSADLVARTLVGHLHNLPKQLEAVQAKGGGGEANVLFWDAVYLSTGLGNYVLGSSINADEWLINVVGPLMAAVLADPSAGSLPMGRQQLLRSRLMWLVRTWLYHFNASVLDRLLSLLVAILDPARGGSDVVASIEAVRLVDAVLDSPGCCPELLNTVLLQLFESLCALTIRLEDSELQATVVVLLGKLVDCAGNAAIVPVLQPLAAHLCTLWGAAHEQSPVRTSILDCVSQMVVTAGSASPALHSVAGPILAASLSGTEESSFLFKDALTLLLAVVRNCPLENLPEPFDSLMPAALTCTFLGDCKCSDADDMRTAMAICEAFCVLRGPRCLLTSGAVIAQVILQLVGQVASNNAAVVIRPIEVLFLSCPTEVVLQFLEESGILHSLLRLCAASTPQLIDCPALEDIREEDVGLVAYLSVIARVLLCEPVLLSHAMPALCIELAPMINQSHSLNVNGKAALEPSELLKAILRLFFDKFDAVGYCTSGMWRRKLWCLALLSLYPHVDLVREWFPEVCDKAMDVLSEEASEEGKRRKGRLVLAISGNFDDMDHVFAGYDSDIDSERGNDLNKAATGLEGAQQESIVVAFERLLLSDIVMATDVKAVLDEKMAQMTKL